MIITLNEKVDRRSSGYKLLIDRENFYYLGDSKWLVKDPTRKEALLEQVRTSLKGKGLVEFIKNDGVEDL